MARTPAGVIAVAGLTVADDRVASIDIILDPEKLAALSIAPDV
ncbi:MULTISPECIES: hypothetical protein [unclassified Nocardioides]|nr:hypothetical protein [Nocardioides sp. URHA0032]